MIVAGVLAGSALAVAAAGRAGFDRQVSREVVALFAASSGAEPAVLGEADLAGLPEPVQRWLRYAQVVGKERPTTVRLKQEGQFRTGEGQGWLPFTAEQYFTTDPPGFLWAVRMRMAPLVSITGRDRYAGGEGGIQMRLLSLVPVADTRGGGLNQGAMLRYLAETVWFPAAAVSRYIAWEGIDANSARATMRYAGVAGSVTFVFDAQGRVVRQTAERYNDARGRLEPRTAPVHAYGEFGGVRVPVEAEAMWNYDSGDFSYIRLRITHVEQNRPARFSGRR
jgi:hypothetical protein